MTLVHSADRVGFSVRLYIPWCSRRRSRKAADHSYVRPQRGVVSRSAIGEVKASIPRDEHIRCKDQYEGVAGTIV
jgi:hypothetical protein